jgi:hypothetical protein
MATTTPNFGWAVPTSTDLVKDGAVAIETLGDSIDASLVDLKGGTTGQVLSKASNTDMDFTWVTDAAGDITGVTAGTGISGGGTSGTVTVTNSMATAIDAKGDLIGGTGADAFARLAVGANGTVLTADSAETTGMKWAAVSGGSSGLTLIARTSFSNVASQIFANVFNSTYRTYMVILEGITAATGGDDLHLQGRYGTTTVTTGYYYAGAQQDYTGAASTIAGSNQAQIVLATTTGTTGAGTHATLYFNQVGNSAQNFNMRGQVWTPDVATGGTVAGNVATTETYTGFVLKSSSSNITGTASIYGLAI